LKKTVVLPRTMKENAAPPPIIAESLWLSEVVALFLL
jgi:hypothetical protein